MKKQYQIALIGCGYWGKNYVRLLSQMHHVKLVAVVDISSSAFSDLEKIYPEVVFTTNEDVAFNNADIDGVIIATPVNRHFELCKKALQHNKHVLCEKPLAQTAEQTIELNQLALEQNKQLLPGHIFIYHDSIAFAQKCIQQKQLGSIHYITCQRTGLGPVRDDVNVVFDLATHDVAIVLHLLGEMPAQVQASGMSYLKNGKEDMAVLQLKFSKNILVNILVSWLHPQKVREMCVVGDKKMLVFNDINPSEKIKIYDKGATHQSIPGDYGQFQLSLRDGDISIPNIKNSEPLKTEVEDFIMSLSGNHTTKVTPQDALNVLKVLELAQQSLNENGKWITLH